MLDKKLRIATERVHTSGGRYYGPQDMDILKSHEKPLKPSWTNVQSVESSPGLSDWKMNNGRWATIDGPTSAIIGTVTHNGADLMNKGKTINTDWILNELETNDDIRWKLVYPSKWSAVEIIKKQLWSYMLWYEEHKPSILATEIMMWHPDVPYAGTADLVLQIYNKRQDQDILMLADLKTGAENEKHFVQCMAYAILLEKIYQVKVSALGVLYCQGKWRDEPKPGKMKVKVVRNKSGEFTDDAKLLSQRVVKLYELWKINQRSAQPKRKIKLPNEFSIKIKKERK